MAFLIYTGLRLLLLVAVIGLFHALGMRGILLLVAGFVVSGVLSYIVLSGPRQRMAQGVGGMFGRINRRIEDSAKAEDDELDDDAGKTDTGDTDVAVDARNEAVETVDADSHTPADVTTDTPAMDSNTASAEAKTADAQASDEASVDLRSPKKAPSQS